MKETFTAVTGEKIQISVMQIQAYWQTFNSIPPTSVIAIIDLDDPSAELQSIQIRDPYPEVKFRIERHKIYQQ
ncbi:MAG TPA: hypothetical protein P5275_18055 [Saprospiraceae bacterium]|nr:hypothetical protein [Saprospiraceae bacterium]MCB9269622.1 hypothetical protein [Lewinellaceae bacterium]HPG06066.1 hypothetical protein [Saprospiraceae bacterium]HPQ98676.1 hypothetical protein [Saprospiraceae bacterium]HQU54504.1 hypothetical protein [Saprospiraceae bacterium]